MPDLFVCDLAGERWAMGLTWLTFAQRPPAAALERTLRGMHARYAALRDAEAFQVGVTSSADPKKWLKTGKGRVAALAAAVAPLHTPPWRGTFQVDASTWWYIAVRDNFAIMTDGDIVGSARAVEVARARHDQFDDWTDHSGGLGDLAGAIGSVGASRSLLIHATAKPARMLSFVAIGVMAVSGIAYAAYAHLQHDRLQATLRRAALAQAHAGALLRPKVVHTPAGRPPSGVAPQAPPQADFVAGCVAPLLRLPMNRMGWSLQEATCDAAGMQSGWAREATDAPGAVDAFGLGTVTGPEGRAHLWTPHTLPRRELPEASDAAAFIERLRAFAARSGMRFETQPQMPGGPTNAQQLTLSGPMPPSTVLPVTEDSGAGLTRIAWRRDLGWTYQLVLHVKSRPS